MDKKAKQEETQIKKAENRTKLLSKKRVPFIFGFIGGIAAIISGIVALVGNWSIVTFNPSSLTALYNQLIANSSSTNSTNLANYISLLSQGAVSLRNALLLYVPLVVIAGAFMLLAAFYLKSGDKRNTKFGIIMMIIFSMFVFIGLMVYLPFNPIVISILDSYLGFNNGTNSAVAIATYGLFLAYFVLGMLAAITKVFQTD